jgi:hypothetical protein
MVIMVEMLEKVDILPVVVPAVCPPPFFVGYGFVSVFVFLQPPHSRMPQRSFL